MKSTVRMFAAAGVVVLLGTAGCLSPYEKGSKFYEAGDFANAATEVQEGLEREPDDPQLNLLMAKTLVAQEEFREAESYAEKAFEAEKTRGGGGRLLGKVHWELGRALKAVEVWREARKVDTNFVPDEDYKRALLAAIGTADSSHKFERALTLREELAEIAPSHPEVDPSVLRRTRQNHAEDLVQRGEYEEAAAVYSELAEGDSDNAEFLYERGRLLLRLKRPDEARTSFDRYVDAAEEGDRMERMLEVARRAKDLNAPRVAVDYYERAVDSLDDEPTFRRAKLRLTLARLYFKTDRGGEARGELRAYLADMESLRGVPLSAEVYVTAAETASDASRNGFAIDLLEEALTEAPPNWTVASRLAQQYAVQARQSEAERVLNTYIDRAETTKALKNAARWARERRNYDLAKHFYERLLENEPDQPDVWLELGKLYAQLGQIENMRRALDTFVDDHGEDRRDLLSVASIYREQKLFENAERVLHEVRSRNPESLLVVDRLAELYRKWDKPERIQEAYRKWIEARGGSPSDYQLVGERLLRRQKLRQALPFLRNAAENGTTEAWLQIADIYKQQRREIDMKEALETYVEEASDRTRALRAALNRYRATSLTRETTDILEELIEREPEVRSHYERLGETYLAQGRRQKTFDLWRSFVERDSDTIDALKVVAGWFEQAGHPELILEFYGHWTETDDPNPRLYRLMGDAYMKLAPQRWSRARFSGDQQRDDARKHARRYYEKYLEQAEPSGSELSDFADSMRKSRMWSTSAEAYRGLVDSVSAGSELRLHFGESMLHLGRADRAMEAFETYYDARGKTPSDAQKIADHLFKFRYLERAEPYLDRMFSSDQGELIQSSFVKLTEIYQHTGRSERISNLVTNFLNRAPNPAKARQLSVQVLERRGLYEEAARQIERIREFQGDVMGFDLGANLFASGADKKAHEAFRTHADESPYSGAVWLKIAEFYETHGRPERAMEAYDNAVDAAPDDFKPRRARGRFRILQGDLEAGERDFRDAIDRASTKHRDVVRKTHVESLTAIGRFDRAAELAKKSLKSASQHRGFFLETLAEHEFKTGDESRVSRMIQRLSSSSLSLEDSVRLLVDNGHRVAAAELIENELDSGNYSSAGRVIVNRPDIFTRLGGVDALKRAARPLLKQQNGDSMLRAQLGEYFIRQGHYDQGIVYLRSASEEGRSPFQNVLAQTYALNGRSTLASELFQRNLRQIPESMRRQALRRVGVRLELAGRLDDFIPLLENLARGESFSGAAKGLLAEHLVATGNLEDALGRIQRLIDGLADEAGAGAELSLERRKSVESVLAVLKAIAGAGYREEAVSLLDELPASVRSIPEVRAFEFHLQATIGSDDLDEHVDTALRELKSTPTKTARERRLSFARVLNVNGRYELAARLGDAGLESSDHKSVQNSTLFLMRNAYSSRRSSRVDELADRLQRSVSDELRAHSYVGRTLIALGLDEAGLARLERVAEKSPTPDDVRAALSAAQAAGATDATTNLIDRYLRVADEPLSNFESRLDRAVTRLDADIAAAIAEPYRTTYPARLSTRLLEARLAFREGDVEDGREILRSYLEEVDFEPRAAERVLGFLDENRLAYEAADVFGPAVDEEARTTESERFLGFAHADMGNTDEARTHFDRAISIAPDNAQAATEIARKLFQNDHPELAADYGDRAVELAPNRPAGRLFRGLGRLSLGDAEAAERDLEIGLGSGGNRLYSLYHAGRAALQSDHREIAAKYLRELAETPNSDDFGVLMPLRLALDAYVESERAEAGVEFLETNFPRIADGRAVASDEILPQISGLYESAGNDERAFEIYRRGIRRELARNPDGSLIPVYLNNLAYVYSTTNRHIDDGLDLARRAIAAARSRTPSYLDTLGWLHYRRGDLARAETDVRRALRTSQGEASDLVELYKHLAELREARGDTEQAFWLRRFYESLD